MTTWAGRQKSTGKVKNYLFNVLSPSFRLSVFDNPCWEEEDLRIRLLIKMTSLKVINKEEVTEDEQLEVKELLEAQNEDAAED